MMKTALTIACLVLVAAAAPAFAASSTDQIGIRYVPPENPSHQLIFDQLKQRGALEKLQKLLSPFRLPRTLLISLDECDGDPDAFYDYDNDTITICYEYVDQLWENMPQETTPSGVEPIDTMIGPLFEVSLHEVGHALFYMLELPVLGREEDAADQVAAYILLQFGESEARRLITGAVHAYGTEAKKSGRCRSLEDFANDHSTPGQRAYNLMCLAYGADQEVFSDFVGKGYLPKERAEYCNEEYGQVQEAFELLINRHVDLDLADKVRNGAWLCESQESDASEKCPPLPLK